MFKVVQQLCLFYLIVIVIKSGSDDGHQENIFLDNLVQFREKGDEEQSKYFIEMDSEKFNLYMRKGYIECLTNITEAIMNRLILEKLMRISRYIQLVNNINSNTADLEVKKLIDKFGLVIKQQVNYVLTQGSLLIDTLLASKNILVQKAKKKDIQYAIEQKEQQFEDEIYQVIEKEIVEQEKPLLIHINKVLDQYDSQQEIYKKQPCYSLEETTKFTDSIRKQLPEIPNPFEHCRNTIHKEFSDYNMRYVYLKDMNPHMVFEFKKCKMVQDNDAKTDIKEIIDDYSMIRLMASRFRCMAVNQTLVGKDQNYFLAQIVDAEAVLDVFEKQAYRQTILAEDQS